MTASSSTAPTRAALRRQAVIGAAVVVVFALVFAGVGALGDDDPTAAGAGTGAEQDEPTADPVPDLPADDVPDQDIDDAPDDEAPDDPDEAPDDPDEAPDDEAEEAPDEDAPPAIDPSGVTVQVLDGFKADGGAAADAVASQLEDAGYDLIARNDALDYAETTVLFNPGNEDAAAQVARELGGAEVRAQPGTLDTGVALHVVVGADRG